MFLSKREKIAHTFRDYHSNYKSSTNARTNRRGTKFKRCKNTASLKVIISENLFVGQADQETFSQVHQNTICADWKSLNTAQTVINEKLNPKLQASTSEKLNCKFLSSPKNDEAEQFNNKNTINCSLCIPPHQSMGQHNCSSQLVEESNKLEHGTNLQNFQPHAIKDGVSVDQSSVDFIFKECNIPTASFLCSAFLEDDI